MRRRARITAFSRSVFAIVAASTLTVSLCGVATAAPASDAEAVSITSKAPRNSVADYWTEERKRSATPEPMRKGGTASAVPSKLPAQSAPGGMPAKLSTAAAPIPAGATAEEWTPHGVMPATTIGTLYYVRDDGSNGYCSASVISAANQSTIWTAGHCVHGGAGREWFDLFTFEPDHDNFTAPLGEWEWKTAATTNGWINDGSFNFDIAALSLFPNNLGNVADVTGWQGFKFNQGHDWNIHFFGYPQDGVPDRPIFDGETLLFCTGPTNRKSVSDDMIASNCDSHHGASGGPWLDDLQTARGWGYIIGAYSSRDGCLCNAEVRSAYHGDAAINVHGLVQAD
jgi:V8-like Glu-specific endopeptidase